MPVAETPVNDLKTVVPISFNPLDWLAIAVLIIGGLNWGSIGLAEFDIVAALFGVGSGLARAVYLLVGLAALYGIYMLFRIGNSSRA